MLNQMNPAHVSDDISIWLRTPHGLPCGKSSSSENPVEIAVGAETPAVIGALELPGHECAHLGGDQPVASVLTDVEEHPNPMVLPAHGDHRVAADLVGDVVTGIRNLVNSARNLPHAGPEGVGFEPGELWRPVPVASDWASCRIRVRLPWPG